MIKLTETRENYALRLGASGQTSVMLDISPAARI
jgi:hypothetical protein